MKLDLKKFNQSQKEQIGLGFLDGLTDEQVFVYAHPKLSWLQMREIRLDFKIKIIRKW